MYARQPTPGSPTAAEQATTSSSLSQERKFSGQNLMGDVIDEREPDSLFMKIPRHFMNFPVAASA